MSTTPPTHAVTRLLLAWSGGDAAASEQLMELVYNELRQLARSYLRRERADHTLQPTALVHEAYLRLVDDSQIQWQSRAHFYGVAARVMRRILVDHARRQAAAKRGGLARDIPLGDVETIAAPDQGSPVDLVALDDALVSLGRAYPRQSEIVELRYFGGLSAREIGEVMQVTERTVQRDWDFARAWLRRALGDRRT